MKTRILCLIILILNFQLSAQENQTLKECISYGIKNNLKLHNADLSEKIAGESYRKSKWNLLPGISAGADAGMNYGRSVDPNTNGIINTSFFNNSYYLGASVDVFRGFMLQNLIRYQKFSKEAAENNLVNTADQLAFSIMNAFYNVIYQEELLKIANEQKAISELNVKKTEILVRTGLKSQTEMLEVKANYEKDQLFCVQTSNKLASEWISLKKEMNLPPDEEIKLDNPDGQLIGAETFVDIPELFKAHSEWSPTIRMFENEWKASLKELNIRKAGYFPSVRFQASMNTGFYETNRDDQARTIAFNDQIKNNRSKFVGATLSIPVFSKNAVRFDVKQSKLSSEQAETRLKQARQDLIYEMEQNYNELTASWNELQQADKQLEADKLSFQAAQKMFDQGMINVVEFYMVKNRLANTTSQVLHSRLTLEIMKRTIDFYKGKRFWEE